MQVKLDNPKVFSDIVSIISELVTEVKIKFFQEEMSIVAIDPANVALVSFKLPKRVFSEFNIESKNETLGVNLDNLKAVLRRAKSGSSLVMENSDGYLKIEIIDKIKRNEIVFKWCAFKPLYGDPLCSAHTVIASTKCV